MPVIPYQIVQPQGTEQADEWLRLGVAAQMSGNLPLAQQHYNACLRLDPRHALAMNNLAIVFAQSNLLNEAILAIERAQIHDGKHAVIQQNWAVMAMDSEDIGGALEHSRESLFLAPGEISTQLAMAMIAPAAGEADEAINLYNRILDKEPAHPHASTNACFVQTLTDRTPAELLAQRKRWWDANHYTGKVEPHANDKTTPIRQSGQVVAINDPGHTMQADRPLRVGYVGGDFKSHSASFIFGRVLLNHSGAVQPYLYSSLPVDPKTDTMTKKFQDMAGDRWRDIVDKSDDDVAAMIRADKIDILVDLAAHTNGGRLRVFTFKPAPVQVTAWGFAHGTGCPEIDYFFADPVAVPPEERQYFAEKIWDLPCLVTMGDLSHYELKGTSPPPVRRNDYFTFGCYARFEKLSDQYLRTCAEILRRVPDSRMEFKDAAFRRPYSIRRVLGLMPDIAPERLRFSMASSHPEHMKAYQNADLVLDVFPHCGGVVSLEMLYMGVPVMTLYGTQPAGRNTSSVLTAMGRTEFISYSVETYIEAATQLSDRTKELAAARKTLREELLSSPVVAGYPEAVETAYRAMWKEWCAT